MGTALMRLTRPPGKIVGGQVMLNGRDLLAVPEREMRRVRMSEIALVPQGAMNSLNPVMRIREQVQDGRLSVTRKLLPLAIVIFVSTFSVTALFALVANAQQQMWSMFHETHEAIEKVQPGIAKLDAAHPLQLTAEDLAKAAPLSERTQRWLRNARISVAPDTRHPGGRYCCGANSRSIRFAPDREYSWYLADIHLPSGSDCTLSFLAGRENGILGGVCK